MWSDVVGICGICNNRTSTIFCHNGNFQGPLMWLLALPGILICIFSLVFGQGRCCFGFIVHSGFGRDIVKVFGRNSCGRAGKWLACRKGSVDVVTGPSRYSHMHFLSCIWPRKEFLWLHSPFGLWS